jgi:hypothetical protein
MTEAYKFISAGTAHTFAFSFQPDKVVFTNLTAYAGAAGTVGEFPVVTWYRGQTTTAHAYQQVVVDTAAVGASYNFLEAAANGFTVADTAGGSTSYQRTITAITQANPCVVTSAAHGFVTAQQVIITDLGSDMLVPRGMGELDGNTYQILRINANTFSLQDPITGLDIDSTAYTAYVTGGFATMISRVDTFKFSYDPITYQLTAGTSVMGANSDVFHVEVFKYGQVTDLGDLLV